MKISYRLFLFVLPALMLLPAPSATAHPLGQFTINHYARIETGVQRVSIRYVVDMAELVAFQEIQNADTDLSGSLSEAESEAYLNRTIAQLLAGLSLSADGQKMNPEIIDKRLVIRPGTADLPTLMIICDLSATAPAGSMSSG